MSPARWQQIESLGGCVDLSRRAKFELTGADRVRYLNGQVTNDVRRADASHAMHACVTAAKGRICANVFIHSLPEALLLDAEEGLRESLSARLERYIVADDVSLRDVTDEWKLYHFFGPASEGRGDAAIAVDRFGVAGVDEWSRGGDDRSALAAIMISDEEAEVMRIIKGVPRWPEELSGDAFPQEAGLEARAMSYTKGCYIGQEVLSRIRSTGRMPRLLVRWQAVPGLGNVRAGTSLWLGGAEVGRITSAVMHPVLGVPVGLAFVRQGAACVDSELLAGNETPSIEASIRIHSLVT